MKTLFTALITLSFSCGGFAQSNTQEQKKEATVFPNNKNEQISPAKKEIYVPEMTKEQMAEQINKERIKQAEMKKNEVLPVEKNADVINEDAPPVEKNVVIMNESQSNVKLLKIESKEKLLNNTEKVNLIKSEKPDKK